jgi:uncharacterized protein YeaO (DUF488 family)
MVTPKIKALNVVTEAQSNLRIAQDNLNRACEKNSPALDVWEKNVAIADGLVEAALRKFLEVDGD